MERRQTQRRNYKKKYSTGKEQYKVKIYTKKKILYMEKTKQKENNK